MTQDITQATIIADTSVWIDYFNGKVTSHTDLLDSQLDAGNVAMFDVILMEVLQGFRLQKDFEQAKNALENLPCYAILGKHNAISFAHYYRQLRQKGITIRKSNDVMIASFCVENDLPLLFCDRDFLPFVQHFGLVPALKYQ